MNPWFAILNGQQAGPFSLDQMRAMAAAGTLTPDTIVWTEGMPGWAPAGSTALAQALAPPAAPPPPAYAPAPSYAPQQAYAPQPAYAAPAPAAFGAAGGPAPPRDFVDAIKTCLTQKYLDFQGRASRSEYWWFFLFGFLVTLPFQLIGGTIGGGLGFLVSLALLLPSIAVGVRRLHDTDRTGWWLLIALVPLVGFIVLIVFFCLRGTEGANRFG